MDQKPDQNGQTPDQTILGVLVRVITCISSVYASGPERPHSFATFRNYNITGLIFVIIYSTIKVLVFLVFMVLYGQKVNNTGRFKIL